MADRHLFHNARLLDPECSESVPGGLLVEGDRIVARLEPSDDAPDDAISRDLDGLQLSPGFIDLHYHGRYIFDSDLRNDDAYCDAIEHAASLSRHGSTAYLATTVATPERALAEQVGALAAALERAKPAGARPIGIHLEGPWINADAAGAQPRHGVRACEIDEAQRLLDRGAGSVRMVTLAPEIPGADALLDLLREREILPALGHSLAAAECVEGAIERGARHVTHLFNAMGPLHHRAPGLAGVALADERVTADLICDGVHVDPRIFRSAARALANRLILITDRIDPPDLDPHASFGSGGLHDDGTALRLEDGRLAGSRLTLDVALRNASSFAALSLLEAVTACTLRPARLLGIESEYGTLRPGARADFVLLDSDARVVETWIAGRRVYPT